MISSSLFEHVLLQPFRDGADELKVLSGYCGASMGARHIAKCDELDYGRIRSEIIYGMAPESGVPKSEHTGFQCLQTSQFPGRFNCQYVVAPPAVHSKLYVWTLGQTPIAAFAGSANFTLTAFFGNRVETMVSCDPQEALDEFDVAKERALECTATDIELSVVLHDSEHHAYAGLEHAHLPFIDDRTGETPTRSGINWGQRSGRDRDQAYLRILRGMVPTGFFPPRGQEFTILWDDGFEFIGVVAQDNDKAVHSHPNNSVLGEYIRKRLGLPSGEYVTAEHFRAYGRDEVMVYKVDEGTYFMDFAIRSSFGGI